MTTTLLAYIPSPSQGVWHFFGVPLRAYALFIIVGIIAALVLGDRRWVARGGEPGVVYDIALWAVPFGLVGGRLYHVITDWRTYFGDEGAGFVAALRIWDGGLGIWGAVALGGIGAWIACRRRGIPLPAFGDAIAPGIILAQAIGRLGNYFNQELFGRPTDLPWGLEIYERRNAAGVLDSLNGVSTGRLIEVVHPTFLYELLWNLLIFAALILVDRRFKIGHGRLFAMYVAGYCLGRFWIELMRSDAATLLAGIRINTFTSTFVFIGAVVYIMAAPKGRDDPATLQGDQESEADEDSDVEDFVKALVVAGSTTGVVAAVKVAGEDDKKSVAEAAEAEALDADVPDEDSDDSVTEADDVSSVEGDAEVPDADKADAPADEAGTDEPESTDVVGGLGSVEGDEVVEAAEDASVVHEAAVEGEAVAEALAAEVDAEDAQPVEVVESVSVTATDEAESTDVVGGVGSVDGDEVVEAAEDASVVHEAAVEGEALAEALAAEVDAEDAQPIEVVESVSVTATDEAESTDVVGGVGSVDGDEVVEAAEDASVVHEAALEREALAEALAAEVEADAEDAQPIEAEESVSVTATDEAESTDVVGGLGSVEGDEVVEAGEDASEVHQAAVEGEADAEALAAEVEAEADAEDAEAPTGEAIAEEPADEAVAEPVESTDVVGGLGSVEGDEVVEAGEDASEVHQAAVEGEAVAEALAGDVEAEPEESEPEDGSWTEADEAESTSEAGGLGSVEGDEVVEAGEDASEVHQAAVEGEAVAESLAADVEAEPGEPEAPSDEDIDEEPAHEPAVSIEAEESPESVTGADEAGGLGSVEGDEVVEAGQDASEVHQAAVEGEAVAESLAADVEAEPDAPEAVAENAVDEPVVEPAKSVEPDEAGGLGSVEGDEVAEAADEASEAHDVTVEGDAEAEALAAGHEAEVSEDSEIEADEATAQVAVEGASVAEALAPEVEAEESELSDKSASDAEADYESVTDAGGAGSVDGDEAVEDASAEQLAVEGASVAEALAAEVEAEAGGSADETEPGESTVDEPASDPRNTERFSRSSGSEPGGRVRQWLRRRRNR